MDDWIDLKVFENAEYEWLIRYFNSPSAFFFNDNGLFRLSVWKIILTDLFILVEIVCKYLIISASNDEVFLICFFE